MTSLFDTGQATIWGLSKPKALKNLMNIEYGLLSQNVGSSYSLENSQLSLTEFYI